MSVLPERLEPLLEHLEAVYPEEGCGVVVRRGDGALRLHPMRNAYERCRQREPDRFPRTARTAYRFDDRELLALGEELDREGAVIACVFHSHVDVGAYFSEEDRAMAAPEGEPLWPGVEYLVVAVHARRATAARLYRWQHGDFSEIELPLPRR